MANMATVEIKAFVPARDFELSKRFYVDLGFELESLSDDLAYFHAGGCSFLLQRFYVREHADNFMMHLLVEDVEAWWSHVESQQLASDTEFVLIRPKTGLGESATSQSTIRLASCGASVRASRVPNKPLKPIAPKTALRFSGGVDMTSAVKCGGELIERALGYTMIFSESAVGGAASTLDGRSC